VIADSYILPECIVRPGSFGGLMVLYEANFIKFNQLVEEMRSFSGEAVSTARTDCDLYLGVTEKTKYTSSIRLTYLFAGVNNQPLADPDLMAKIYFDAGIVEVRGWRNGSRHQILRSLSQRYASPRTVDLCWARNIMLSKWLDYLLDKGHRFSLT